MRYLTLIVSILFVATCVPGLCDSDLTTGSDAKIEFRPGGYFTNSSGNQDMVRQFDGRTFHAPNVELLDTLGYNGPYQYFIFGRDLGVTDSDVDLALAYKNIYNMKIGYSQLTHRLVRIPSSDPSLVGTPAAGGNDFVDLSPNQDFFFDRNVTDLRLGVMAGPNQVARLVTGLWEEHDSGTQQLLFRAREAAAVIANRARGGVGVPIDRTTRESSLGTDFRFGGASVLNYRFYSTKFGEDNGRPVGASFNFLPLNQLTVVGSDTESHVFKARSSIGQRLYFTGVQTNRNRKATRASAGSPDQNLNSTNLATTYLATDNLTFTARYRRFSQEDHTLAVLVSGDPQNSALTSKENSVEFESTYTGVPKTFLRAGYERRNVDRDPTPVGAAHTQLLPVLAESTDSNIVRLSARYYPFNRLSLSAGFEDWTYDNATFPGTPTDTKKVNANANYMVRDDLAFFANYSMVDGKNDLYAIDTSTIPTPATDAAGQDIREEAAGQGTRNTFKSFDVGTWYALNSRLTLDANYARISNDASTLWIIGADPTYPPHIAPNVTPYFARDNQWSLGATYVLTPKTRVYGRFFTSGARGKTTIDPATFPGGIGPTWNPVDVMGHQWTAGFSRDLTFRDTLLVDYSLSRWTDYINPANNGWFGLLRFAWSRHY